jgi:hypothetical protein
MPRKVVKDKSQRVAQKQKQSVKQTVKVVIGDQSKKRAKRVYRRKASEPKQAERPYITPPAQVITVQAPTPFFSPEQFSKTIAMQLNELKQAQPVLAEPAVAPMVAPILEKEKPGSILAGVKKIVEPKGRPQSPVISEIQSSVSAPTELTGYRSPFQRRSERTQTTAMFERPRTLFEQVVGGVPPEPRPAMEPSIISMEQPPRAVRLPPVASGPSGYIRKADLEQIYLRETGEMPPPSMRVMELRKEVNRLRKKNEA